MITINIFNPIGEEYLLHGSTGFPITDKCERSAKIMGDDYVRLVFNATERVVLSAFSYIEYKGQTFFLPEEYRPKPNGTEQNGESVFTPYYTYDVKFVSIGNMLSKHICYREVRVRTSDNAEIVYDKKWYEPEININGTLDTMYIIIVNAINRAADEYKDYKYGKMLKTIHSNGLSNMGNLEEYYVVNTNNVHLTADTELHTFNFSGDNIANVCTSVANTYTEDDKDTEWYITENNGSCTLHFAKCFSNEEMQVFDDYNNGMLKPVEYAQQWTGIAQVIIPFGSDRNMTYEAVKGMDLNTQMQSTFGKRLRLDPNTTYELLDENGNQVTLETNAFGGVVNNLVNTGIEQVQFYDDIYPQCHFKVTKVSTIYKKQDDVEYPVYTITAVAIDSNDNPLNPNISGFYPIEIEEGKTLSIRFEKGLLSGREFEIKNKSHKPKGETDYTMCVTIVSDGSIEDGTLIPSGNFKPNVGDEFALFNMKMPQVYIDYAKNELALKAYKELIELQTTRPEVKCSSNPTNFNGLLGLGNRVCVLSELFNNERAFESRMVAYSYKLTKPSDVQFNLASSIRQGTLSQMNDAIVGVSNTTAGLEQKTLNLSRRGYRDMKELSDMVDSLATEMMVAGNEKYQFGFSGSFECVNNQAGLFDCLKVYGGTLQHTQLPYTAYANGGWWQISTEELRLDKNDNPLDPNAPYYLYADCHDDSQAAPLLLSLVKLDDEQYLLMGVLSSEYEGKRVFNRTNGYTAIAGGTITTEQIQDANRSLIIDFQRAEIIARRGAVVQGNIKFLASDGSMNTLGEMLNKVGVGGENLLDKSSFSYEYKVGYKIGLTLLMPIKAGKKYVCTKGKFVNNATDDWANGVCLVVAQNNQVEDIKSVHDFNEPIIVSGENLFLYIAWGNKEYVEFVKGSTPDEYITTECTQHLDYVMVQEGEIPTSYIPYVNHIVNAIQGTTEIDGGLVMTNVLGLKDEKDNIVAGMSGLSDNILVWGGTDYHDALYATNNNFNKKDGDEITTLVKKDGTGKVGIFKISNTQAVIDIKEQGKVIIDASADSGGIYLVDKDYNAKTIISPKGIDELEGSIGLESHVSKHEEDIELKDYDEEMGEYGSRAIKLLEIENVKALMYEYELSIPVIEDNIADGVRYFVKTTNNLSTIEHTTIVFSEVEIPFTKRDIVDGYVTLHCKAESQNLNTGSTSDFAYIYVSVGNDWIDLSRGAFIKDFSAVLTSSALVADGTIVGKDGLVSIHGSSMFKVQNTVEGQKIYAKGLSDGSDRVVGSGELYVTSSFVDAFVSFLDEFYSYVEMVRTIGGNNDNANNMQDKIKTIKETLKDSSGNRITNIIASS